jgi:predicted metal-dependent RNase
LVGYQSVGSLGRKIAEKPKEIEIMDNGRREKIKVRATIESIMGYSSHKDSEHLLEFVEQVIDKSAHLKKVFVIMGEPKSSLFLCQRLHDYLDVDAVYPTENTEYSLGDKHSVVAGRAIDDVRTFGSLVCDDYKRICDFKEKSPELAIE